MTERLFRVTLEGPDGQRDVVVPSPTAVQASDAAVVDARAGEAIVSIHEVDADAHHPDVAPPVTQAEATPQPGDA